MATFSYDGTQYIGPDVQAITPNDRFYLVTKNVVNPRADKSLWRLEVTGRVDRPHTYRFEELAALPATIQAMTLTCISNHQQLGRGRLDEQCRLEGGSAAELT